MTNNNLNHLGNCDFAKTILMLCVVLCHSVAFYGGNWFTALEPASISRPLALLSSWLGTFHVQGFTLISGYLFYYLKEENGKYGDFRSFAKKKAKRLLLPYIAVALIWVVPIGDIFFNYSLNDVIHKYILGESPSQLWFLLMLFNVFIIAYVAINKKVTRGGQIAIVLSICGLGILLPFVLPSYYQIFAAMKYLLFFYTGYLIRANFANLTRKHSAIIGSVLLILNLSLFALWMNLELENTTIVIKGVKMLASLLCEFFGAIMAFSLLSYLSSSLNLESRFFKALSKASFPIYLFHQQIIYAILNIIPISINPVLGASICFFFSIGIAYLISLAFNSNKYTRVMIGA